MFIRYKVKKRDKGFRGSRVFTTWGIIYKKIKIKCVKGIRLNVFKIERVQDRRKYMILIRVIILQTLSRDYGIHVSEV